MSRRGSAIALFGVQIGPTLVLVSMGVLLSFLSPYFLTSLNLQNLAAASTLVAALAVGELMVVLTGGIDLSVGSTVALSTVIGAKFTHSVSANPTLVIAVMLGVGAAIGLTNGLLIVKARLASPFVITLGMLSIVSGITFVLSGGGTIIGVPHIVNLIGAGFVGPVPISVLVVLGFAAVYHFIAAFTLWGRWIFAIGGNAEAARRVGIPANAVSISVYVLSGIGGGLAGVIAAGITDSGYPTAGQMAELDAISAVIIGGASFAGGRGSVLGALVGSLILATIHNGLNLLNINTSWAPFVLGSVLISAVGLDQLRTRMEISLRLSRARALSMLDISTAEDTYDTVDVTAAPGI